LSLYSISLFKISTTKLFALINALQCRDKRSTTRQDKRKQTMATKKSHALPAYIRWRTMENDETEKVSRGVNLRLCLDERRK
jgi:hypothetical protein